ncbi:MAG: cell wall hydrolase [Sphingobium sp.]|uniref:cell wall hydrolase n=1 Tax=Sphingobium sp. TaxID=1912891 RepID=UPI0029BD28E7|nr:cell wall hydrolase [Sphingobium sp.]MDX3908687.1 cell wall hydrolase [Sphingobium sp.]
MRGHSALLERPTGYGLREKLCWLGLIALALLARQVMPAATLGALDLVSGPPSPGSDHDRARENFPGSAFFYVEGAFDPAPDVAFANDTHVLALSSSPAALALPFRARSALDQYRATNCLTSAIYYEAGNEPEDGQRAVAQVVLNRMRHPAWPHSVCAVVYQGSERADTRCQFTFSCDGAMARVPASASWARARRVATEALAGSVFAPVGLATHYHTLAVHPHWAGSLTPVAVVGAHIFYRLRGDAGSPRAFSATYTGLELQTGPSPRTATPDKGILPPIAPIITFSSTTSPVSSPSPVAPEDSLPRSTIRPEFRSSGRPLI